MGTVSYDFTGDVVIVTGAARGVARDLTHRFVAAGAKVVAADQNRDGLTETCADLDSDAVAQVTGDVSDEDVVKRIVQTAEERFGKLNACVNIAAVAPHATIFDMPAEIWDKMYACNARSTFLMTRTAAKLMIDGGKGGRIINFSSGVAGRGWPGSCAYASSRAATESFTRVAAIELAPHNILVNCISPGLLSTQPQPLPPKMAAVFEPYIAQLPLRRMGEPREISEVVMFLASESASFVTGATWSVDGAALIGSYFDGLVMDDDPRSDWVLGRKRSNEQ